jgi:hypothetical protein
LGHFLKGRLIGLRNRLESRSKRGAWRSSIEQVIQDLEDLNGRTERDFLAVGERLMEFRSMSRRISSDMASLTELISGEQGRNVSRALDRILDLASELNGQIEHSGQALEQVCGFSSHVRSVFAGLRDTVAIFRTLCTLTRIETSRLGNTGAEFGDLAAEARPLSESIQSSGDGVLEASSQLDLSILSAIQGGAELRARQVSELPALSADVSGCLQAFEERQQRAIEASARQAAQYEALSGAVDGVVRSVQFHDITRQQIEHVVQALRQLLLERGRSDTLTPEGSAILALQSSQLAGAARLFASSVEGTERDLEDIAARVQEMAEGSRSLMGISAGEQDSFFLRMEGQFTAMLQMLNMCTKTQAAMESMASYLEETIGRMRDSVAEIRSTEIRIQRIATNAVIRAVHIGDAGNGLNVIAEIMGRLALDSNKNTEDVAATIEAMGDAASRVCGGSASEASNLDSRTNEVIAEMRHTIMELHSSAECSFSRVTQIADSGSQLVRDIATVRGDFAAGRLFARVVAGARGELERIGAHDASESSTGADGVPAEQLESLTKRYTMQIEREVHETMARGSSPAAPVLVASGAAVEDTELGDNVELF